MKIATKFAIAITCILIVTIAAVSGSIVYSNQKRLAHEIKQHHNQIAQQLGRAAEESLYESDLIFLNQAKLQKQERGFLGACFVDSTNRVRFHSDVSQVDTTFAGAPSDAIAYTAPVQFVGQPVGQAHLFVSKTAIDGFLANALREDMKRIGIIALMVLIVALLGVVLVARTMVTLIRRVVQGMREVAGGRRERIEFANREDEMGWMGKELNTTIDKLKELDDMKRDFVAGITHDLRSPLDVIQGFLSLQLSSNPPQSPERQREMLIQIQNNTSRLRHLIDDLLLTSRLEAHREEFERTQFDVNTLAQEMAVFYRTVATQKNLVFTVALSASHATVWADRDKTVQVLHNLLSNAFKYTSKGTVQLIIDTSTADVVRVVVADSGSGIPAAERSKVFEKFFRSSSNAKQAKGTGLGLSIVKALVEGQGGRVGVGENPGGGSRFWFTLPR